MIKCVFSFIVSFNRPTSNTFVLRIGYRLTVVVVHCLCVFCLSVAVLANKVYHKWGGGQNMLTTKSVT